MTSGEKDARGNTLSRFQIVMDVLIEFLKQIISRGGDKDMFSLVFFGSNYLFPSPAS
jgi:hypothetical protein